MQTLPKFRLSRWPLFVDNLLSSQKSASFLLVSRGHTPFRKRGKGSGNFRYSSLLPRTVECGPITAHYSVT